MDTLMRITDHLTTSPGIQLKIDKRWGASVTFVTRSIAHVRIFDAADPQLDRTWSISLGSNATPRTGLGPRDLLDHSPAPAWAGNSRDVAPVEDMEVTTTVTASAEDTASHPEFSGVYADEPVDSPDPDEKSFIVGTDSLRVIIRDCPLRMTWQRRADDWVTVSEDRPTGAYEIKTHTGRVAHHRVRNIDDRYYGLGEKSGDLERTGRIFDMRCLDALGYDAGSTDPLYKHVPFLMTRTANGAFGIFYDNLSASRFNLGAEVDNYHRPFTSWQADHGDIDYWVMTADHLCDLTPQILRLTGNPAFLPRWALGYSGSTMHYTDAPDASCQLLKFIDLLREHAIPCDSFQLSSGYTTIGSRRYVFTWDRDKFSQPTDTTRHFRDAGLHLAANIKPALLTTHPYYRDVAEAGIFVTNSRTGEPATSMFWGGHGGNVDFTNPRGVQWWKGNVRHQLIDMGIESTWNDNNEYELWSEDAICDGFGHPVELDRIRPVQALLMSRASFEAQREAAPVERPFLISRSGPLGLQRYVQTWSGDNSTSWRTLKYNTRMGVGMSMSGQVNFGHDVGGFAGTARPGPELFARWVANGVMHPRFTIHSWHNDGSVNEPWMYPEITDIVREMIRLRYRLIPFLYTLSYLAAERREPIVNPVFSLDDTLHEESDDFLLGHDLLVASVVEKGQTTRTVTLPHVSDGWFEFDTGVHHDPGTVTLEAPLDRLPLLVRAGAGIPQCELPAPSGEIITTRTVENSPHRIVLYLPDGNGHSQGFFFDDDGHTNGYRQGHGYWLTWSADHTDTTVIVHTHVEGDYQPSWGTMAFALRPGDDRAIKVVADAAQD